MKKKQPERSSAGIIGLIIGLVLATPIVIAIFVIPSNESEEDKGMGIYEAHDKCIALEMADLWLYNPDHNNLYERADKSCLLSWDSPDKEKGFIEAIKLDWENHKDDVVDGITVQELYDKIRLR